MVDCPKNRSIDMMISRKRTAFNTKVRQYLSQPNLIDKQHY